MLTYQVKQNFDWVASGSISKMNWEMLSTRLRGLFFKIPKTFTIYDKNGQEVSHITKKTISFLPKFVVELKDVTAFYP